MQWVRYRVRTTPEAEDILISELCALGFEGAQIEDNVPLTAAEKEQIYTYDADDPVDDGIACVSFYTELKEDGTVTLAEGFAQGFRPEEMQRRVEETVADLRTRMEIGDGTVDVSVMDDADWKDNWKQFFHSFYVDDVFITPSWEAEESGNCTQDTETVPERENDTGSNPENSAEKVARYTLKIDPGTAFGTGAHETTQIAIRLVRKAVESFADKSGAHVLDIGTGSGILGILALMFGADKVTGVDVDAFTEEAVRQNLEQNGIVKEQFTLLIGNLLEDEAFCARVLSCGADKRQAVSETETVSGYDIAVANILPVVLKPLTPIVPRFLKPGGIYIVSGILREKEAEMRTVLEESGFEITETMHLGEWCGIAARV